MATTRKRPQPLSEFPKPDLDLPIAGPKFERPDPEVVEAMYAVSSATASAMLHRLGLRGSYIQGPVARQQGRKVVGPAVTLQFMPRREDIASSLGQEQTEKASALWSVFDEIQTGDVLTVQAFGDMHTGCMGEMLVTYLKGRGGVGVVVDGCVRDWPQIQKLDVPIWTRGFTPNYASQETLFPWAYNVPIACSRTLVLPGDIIIADDDGAVAVPRALAELVLERTKAHEDWEVFSRIKLLEGGALRKYYPLSDEGWEEYEQWLRDQGRPVPEERY